MRSRHATRPRFRPAAARRAAAAAACAAGAEHALRGRYVGTLMPQAGPACDAHGLSELIVGTKRFTFTPNGGVLSLRGTLPPPGEPLHARLALPGMDHKPFAMAFDATPQQDGTIVGTLASPDCRSTIALRRG